MAPPAPELYAPCPHCGEPIALKSLVLRAQRDPSMVAHVPPAAAPPSELSPPRRTQAPRPSPPPARTATWRNLLPVRIWKRYFPPVRLVWIFLALLVWNVDGFVTRAVATPLLVLPLVGALADLGLQASRFPKLRFPDAAIANGMFLSLILWPSTVSLELVAVAVGTVGFRHLVRRGGHPVFNPAALGVTLAAVVFAMPQPWHVGFTLRDSVLIAGFGLILWSRAWHTWRLWAVYFVANIVAILAIAGYLGGPSTFPLVVQTSVLGGAPVFFGFFMVTEPRTAPSARWAMVVFGVVVGVSSAVLPVLFAENLNLLALGVLTPYLALFIGNLLAIALPSARGARFVAPVTRRGPGPRAARATIPDG